MLTSRTTIAHANADTIARVVGGADLGVIAGGNHVLLAFVNTTHASEKHAQLIVDLFRQNLGDGEGNDRELGTGVSADGRTRVVMFLGTDAERALEQLLDAARIAWDIPAGSELAPTLFVLDLLFPDETSQEPRRPIELRGDVTISGRISLYPYSLEALRTSLVGMSAGEW